MLEQNQLNKIKEAAAEFFEKMTMPITSMDIGVTVENAEDGQGLDGGKKNVVSLEIKTDEPQILIGQQGQTLFEIQRLLRTVLNKKLGDQHQESFFFNLDINEYKKKKMEYLKDLARALADQVSLNKTEKVLLPMSSYERRVIHAELAQRTDVITESRGDGLDRCVVIKPK